MLLLLFKWSHSNTVKLSTAETRRLTFSISGITVGRPLPLPSFEAAAANEANEACRNDWTAQQLSRRTRRLTLVWLFCSLSSSSFFFSFSFWFFSHYAHTVVGVIYHHHYFEDHHHHQQQHFEPIKNGALFNVRQLSQLLLNQPTNLAVLAMPTDSAWHWNRQSPSSFSSSSFKKVQRSVFLHCTQPKNTGRHEKKKSRQPAVRSTEREGGKGDWRAVLKKRGRWWWWRRRRGRKDDKCTDGGGGGDGARVMMQCSSSKKSKRERERERRKIFSQSQIGRDFHNWEGEIAWWPSCSDKANITTTTTVAGYYK